MTCVIIIIIKADVPEITAFIHIITIIMTIIMPYHFHIMALSSSI